MVDMHFFEHVMNRFRTARTAKFAESVTAFCKALFFFFIGSGCGTMQQSHALYSKHCCWLKS